MGVKSALELLIQTKTSSYTFLALPIFCYVWGKNANYVMSALINWCD